VTVTWGSGLRVREMPSWGEVGIHINYFHDASDGHLLTLGGGVIGRCSLRVEPGVSARKLITTGQSSAEVLGDVPGSRV
jgi:hypothetical protein